MKLERYSAAMSSPSNIAELEKRLRQLAAPAAFSLSYEDLEKLLPAEDLCLERVERFAFEHGCMPVHWQGAVIFKKLPPM
jgi:hypothetical protein